MECKCGAETVQRTMQSTIKGDCQKVEYQACPKCGRQHVFAHDLSQWEKVSRMQNRKNMNNAEKMTNPNRVRI